MKRSPQILLHVFFPLLVGGLIYLCWRSQSMLMFDWVHSLGLSSTTELLRSSTSSYRWIIPDWILYSGPDGAWVWSMTSCYTLIWKRIRCRESAFWISLSLILGVGGELGQLTAMVPGTFDFIDIAVMTICAFLPYFLLTRKTTLDPS